MAQDAVGNILTDTATIDFTYNDTTPAITADVKDDSITFAKMQNIGSDHFIGRHTSGNGDPQQVSASQARSILNVENGAEVNNISDTNATDLTDGGNTTLHIHDSRYYTETETDTLLSGYIPTSQKGANSGVAELDSGGKVPSSQLPSFVDDVVEVANFAALPVTGETGKIYVTLDTNLTYRWSGTAYVEISASLALGETSSTAYRGDRGKIAYDHSQVTTGNPHNVLATQITDFDTEVSNNTDVAANTTARHAALTVTDSSEIDFTLTGQDLTASIKSASIDETKLDASVNASLDLADTALQPADIASGTITARADDINFSGGSDGDVLTVQADGSLALETPTAGGSATNNVYFTARLATDAALPANTYLLGVLTAVSLGALTVDGVAVANGDLILVKNEATGANNGLYTVTNLGSAGVAYVLTRSTQMDASGEFVGAVIPVRSEGTVNANTEWRCTNTTAPTVGTTAITFAIQSPNNVSDTAYDATSWNGVTTIAPSKNAVRDKIDTMDTAIALNTAKVTNATHTGDVTGDTALTIANDAVTYAKMQNVSATDKVLGRSTAGAGDVEEIDCTSLGRAIISRTTPLDVRNDINAQENLNSISLSTSTAAVDDKILMNDTSLSNVLRFVTPQTILDLMTFTDTDDIDLTRSTNAVSGVLKKEFISAKTDTVITASDEIIFGDATDSGNLKKDTVQGILDLVSSLPAGAVTDFAGSTLPTGWLWCDGSVISRTTYADLFTAISTTYGAGDGSTTFALPDARGRVTAGKDNMDNTVGTGGGDAGRLTSGSKAAIDGDTLGASGGVQEHLLLHEESGVPAHSHPYLRHNTVTRTSSGANTAGAGSVGATTSNNTAADAAQAHTNVQPTLVLNKIIKI
jgi:microcystin-dependent protein